MPRMQLKGLSYIKCDRNVLIKVVMQLLCIVVNQIHWSVLGSYLRVLVQIITHII